MWRCTIQLQQSVLKLLAPQTRSALQSFCTTKAIKPPKKKPITQSTQKVPPKLSAEDQKHLEKKKARAKRIKLFNKRNIRKTPLKIDRKLCNPNYLLTNAFKEVRKGKESDFKEASTFQDLGVSEALCNKLSQMKITKPTPIQQLSIPRLLTDKSVLLASHTGSGKTLCYLLPLLQKMWREEEQDELFRKRGQRMRSLILIPTRELGLQLLSVISNICEIRKTTRSYLLSGGFNEKIQTSELCTPLDILISTPERLLYHYSLKHIHFDDLKHLVIDEADTVCSDPFKSDLSALIKHIREAEQNKDQKVQAAIVSATITRSVVNFAKEHFEDLECAATDSLHKSVETLRETFVPVEPNHKISALLEVMKKNSGVRTMIFCNTQENCKKVYDVLKQRGYSVGLFTSELKPYKREEIYHAFMNKEKRVLVCTDIVSRGMDLEVDHVIQYDFPYNAMTYLHRVGRTARCDAKGKATSLVTPSESKLADIIQKSSHVKSLENTPLLSRKYSEIKKERESIKESADLRDDLLL